MIAVTIAVPLGFWLFEFSKQEPKALKTPRPREPKMPKPSRSSVWFERFREDVMTDYHFRYRKDSEIYGPNHHDEDAFEEWFQGWELKKSEYEKASL